MDSYFCFQYVMDIPRKSVHYWAPMLYRGYLIINTFEWYISHLCCMNMASKKKETCVLITVNNPHFFFCITDYTWYNID